jgi:hypothetical protein
MTCGGLIRSNLGKATDSYEASFASKLLPTIEPSMPVVDSIVLGNLNLKLPWSNSKDRFAPDLHASLLTDRLFNEFLSTQNGKYLVHRFHAMYPHTNVTEIKMLDLVLWQTRPTRTLLLFKV